MVYQGTAIAVGEVVGTGVGKAIVAPADGIVAENSAARSGDKGSSVAMASMIASLRAPVATESASMLCALLTMSSLDTALPE